MSRGFDARSPRRFEEALQAVERTCAGWAADGSERDTNLEKLMRQEFASLRLDIREMSTHLQALLRALAVLGGDSVRN